MQTPTLISIAALLLAATAVGLGLARGPDTPAQATALSAASDAAAASEVAASSSDDGLSRRVARLEAEVVMLRRALQQQQGPAPAQAAMAPPADGVPVVAGEVAEAAVAEAIASAPEVTATIEALVDQKMQARRDERWARRSERVAEHDAEMIQAVRDKHEVDDDAAEKMSALLSAEREQVFAHFREARDNGGWREARDKIQAITQETDSNVAALLDEEAFATWSALRDERASRWERGRGRGRRDGEGRGGERGEGRSGR